MCGCNTRKRHKPKKRANPLKQTAKTKAKPKRDNRQKPDQPEKTRADRNEYDKARNQRSDRKEYRRKHTAKRRREAIAKGICTSCEEEPPQEGKTRCRRCADKHNADNRKYAAKPEAIEKQKARGMKHRERKTQTAEAE